jgi:hypothetical protein
MTQGTFFGGFAESNFAKILLHRQPDGAPMGFWAIENKFVNADNIE